ncbi:taurine catabolism dioxygenase TauD [Thiocapsa imhoffii]|uniref:Taurine catabolism dioxygenase TauD n=1 Tax=Thiocapsa imhoffii TaxID=382777 RepID=A0A9X0WG74_9GAMM|nr:TauD/TfdA family dioxygenase [Thiocapsa imhoffii]MBK1644131.1 taurine catabolism dioxygenase TauD [Thiocapsa imhoffii]
MNAPFEPSQANQAYDHWRARKLSAYPADIDQLRVSVRDLARPEPAELATLRARVTCYNMAIVATAPDQVEPSAMIAFAAALGLRHSDANHFADPRAVSAITAEPSSSTRISAEHATPSRADFIPYTRQALNWHTDGYYNEPDQQVGSWILFCARPARHGGANRMIDHEIAYLRLRDESPDFIAALQHPRAFTIPAHRHAEVTLRPASIGPVFSWTNGHLHMRYSARTRHVEWLDTPEMDAARVALDRLFSDPNVFTFDYRLQAGEGLISNNVLHCRSSFEDDTDPARARLLYRIRFRERIATTEGLDVGDTSRRGTPRGPD